MALVSILIPVYNEEEYLAAIVDRVLAAPLPDGLERELIVVDDGSSDGSREAADEIARRHPGIVRVFHHPKNRGKGAAIRTALEHAQGEFSLIQDADFEYDPKEYPHLLRPLLDGRADAVFGSRFMAAHERRVLYYWHSLANHMLTLMVNLAVDLNLTDMETCYKVFRTALIQSIPLYSERFGIEPEITIKLAKRHARIYETPIRYHGRTYEEGKKIGFKDAMEAIFVTIRYALSSDIYKDPGPETLHALSEARQFNLWMADTIRPYVGQHVLEIGAGIGNLTRVLLPKRSSYLATDIDGEHLRRLRNRFAHRTNLSVARCDVAVPEHFAGIAGRMDTVLCLNVLEHVVDDVAALRNIHGSLRPGGKAVILVPHDQRIFGTLDEALGHHRRYAHQELRQRMEQAGFEVAAMLDFNRISRWPWYISGRILKRRALGSMQMRLFDKFVWLWRKIDGSLPWPPASVIAIGVKTR